MCRESQHPVHALCSRQVREGALYVNGEPRTEPYILEQPKYLLPRLTVPPGDVSAAAQASGLCMLCMWR